MGVTNGVVAGGPLLGKEGYQVISFHSTGAGGRAMEELIAQGTIKAVIDLTLHEIVAEMFAAAFPQAPATGWRRPVRRVFPR